MRTIRGRLFLSMILVMFFSVAITIFLFVRYTDGMLLDQAKRQLEIQLEKALQVVNDGNIDDLNDTDLQLRFRDRLFNASYCVLNAGGRVIASSDPTWIGRKLSIGPSGTTGTISLQHQDWLYTVDDVDDRHRLMLYTPLDDLRNAHRDWIALSIVVLIANTLFLLMVGLLFIWNTIRPLNRLKQAVSQFQPNRFENDLPSSDSHSEIGQLMITFQSMAARIRQHHERQVEFLHQISHELKTPLMSIQGYALAVQDQVVAQEQAIGVIRKESQRLIEMVNRLLELARLESTEEVWPLSLVDLREMAEQATEIMAPLAADRNVRLSVRSDGPVETEIPGEQMFQVMLNLLHNAVRHAASKARITVRGQAAGGWSVDVEDDGEGVPEALREKVFDRFYKGVKGGTGLGLTICRQIAERMGATIVCRRSEWGGAWFRFECPSSRKTPARSADD